MGEKTRRFLMINFFLHLIALIFALKVYDVAEVGPEFVKVGLSRVNIWFRNLWNYGEGMEGCGWEMFPQNADMMFHDGDTNSYSAVDVVFHASDAEKRCYFLMMSCCNGNDEHEEENDETAEAENDETEDDDKEVEFDQYQMVFDLCKK